MPETRAQTSNNTANAQADIEPYKLSEIFSLIPEFDGDQISLGTFLNACDCANDMTVGNQKVLLVIHIKNRLRGRAAQLVNSRNPSSYAEIKRLLNLHFGDSRDLSSLIQDLQRLKQLQGESPLTFFNRLQVLNAKMHAFIQKTPTLNNDQKIAQCTLIDAMALNTLLTGMEPRLGQIIRAGDPRDLPDAHARIRRELQLSYFEVQKSNKTINAVKRENNIQLKRAPSQGAKCYTCGRTGHMSYECRSQQPQRPNYFQNNSYIKREGQQTQTTNSNNAQQPQTPFRPSIATQQFQGQARPSVIQKGPNFQSNQHRAHYMNYNSQYYGYPDDNSYEYYPETPQESFQESPEYDGYDYNQYDPNISAIHTGDYQNFLSLPNQNHPPNEYSTQETVEQPTMLQEIQDQIQTLNLDNMDPNLNFPEQNFL